MRKEPFKVNESEFNLIQQIRNLKEKGFTDEDILRLDRSKEIDKEAMQNSRKETIELNKHRLKHNERAIEHKKGQIENKESLEKEESYLDNKKPFFMLQNEIEILQVQNLQLEGSNKILQEEYDRDKKNEQKT